MSFLENINWRFATKKFDSKKDLSEQDIAKILEAIRLTPTSLGLQPFHVVVVKDKEIKKKLRVVSYLQSQVTDASHLLVFCSYSDLKNRVNQYMDLSSEGKISSKIKLQPLKIMMEAFIKKRNESELLEWSRRQAYIALGFGLAACAELKIDSCPMEGFLPEKVDKILNLPPEIKSVVYLAIGYRKAEPKYKKVRIKEEDLFTKKY